jgi:hypothetical protein
MNGASKQNEKQDEERAAHNMYVHASSDLKELYAIVTLHVPNSLGSASVQ